MYSPAPETAAGRVLAVLKKAPVDINLSCKEIWNAVKLDSYFKSLSINAISQALSYLTQKGRVVRYGPRGRFVFRTVPLGTITPPVDDKPADDDSQNLVHSAVIKYIQHGLDEHTVDTIVQSILNQSISTLLEDVGLTRGEVLAVSRKLQ